MSGGVGLNKKGRRAAPTMHLAASCLGFPDCDSAQTCTLRPSHGADPEIDLCTFRSHPHERWSWVIEKRRLAALAMHPAASSAGSQTAIWLRLAQFVLHIAQTPK